MEEFHLTRATALALCLILAGPLAAAPVAAQAAPQSSPDSSPDQAPAKPLTVEAIYAHGPLAGKPPESLAWSPDGKHLTYLDSGELIDLDPETDKTHVLVSRAKLAPISGANDSETDRDHRERYKMDSYQWAPDSEHLLFDASGRLWIYDLHNGTGVQIGFSNSASGDDPKFSPNGDAVSFIRDHSLVAVRLRDRGTPLTVLAGSPNSSTLNGEVDWVYEEELETRSNYFWSPDSKSLAYLQMVETDVSQYPIEDWIPAHAKVDMQHYPQPGDRNPDVRVGVVNAKGGKTSWIRLPFHGGDDYIPRFGWIDRKNLWIETLTRDQKHRTIYFANVTTGMSHVALDLVDENFLDDDYDVSVADGWIVLTNWSDGHRHIYLYKYDRNKADSATASLVRQLTTGDFEVGDIERVDTDRKTVFYTSNEGARLDSQLWQVSFDGERKQWSASPGLHEPKMSPKGGDYVDLHSTLMKPPDASICHLAGTCTIFWQTHAVEAYHLRAPERLELKAHDGTLLYATLLLPEGATAAASVPLIVNPYGGPGVQTVANAFILLIFRLRR